ncbi:MAG: hypothetical protein ACRC80_18430, partial [Waterburya sp.]
MESAKIVNKILLSSLAFGATFGIGMLVTNNENIKKALMGTGAAGSMACVTGALVANKKKDSQNYQDNDSSDIQISELRSQELQLQQSVNETTAKMQAIEADINSLQTEQNQLLSIISDLNNQKLQLETEYNNWNEEIQSQKQEIETVKNELVSIQKQEEELNSHVSNLETQKQNLELEKDNLQIKVEALSFKHEQLEQVIAPIEESLANFDVEAEKYTSNTEQTTLEFESETLNSEVLTSETADEPEQNLRQDTNSFTNFSEQSEANKNDKNLESESVDQLIGSFDESELVMFEQKASEDLNNINKSQSEVIVNVIDEESDFELSEEQTTSNTIVEQVEHLISSIDETELEILNSLEAVAPEESQADNFIGEWSTEEQSESEEFNLEAVAPEESQADNFIGEWSTEEQSESEEFNLEAVAPEE